MRDVTHDCPRCKQNRATGRVMRPDEFAAYLWALPRFSEDYRNENQGGRA